LPQRPSAAQTPAWHWGAAEHWVPAGYFATQLLALQKLPDTHSVSLAQCGPQLPLLQAPPRHSRAAVQAWVSGVPHLPSLEQVPATQAVAFVQAWPLGSLTAQVPEAVQKSPPTHCASLAQVEAQLPLTQAPPRQTAPLTHWERSGWPQAPSAPQTPLAHWPLAVQGASGAWPLGAAGRQAWLVESQ
jgi:hypothetical protein